MMMAKLTRASFFTRTYCSVSRTYCSVSRNVHHYNMRAHRGHLPAEVVLWITERPCMCALLCCLGICVSRGKSKGVLVPRALRATFTGFPFMVIDPLMLST